MSETAGGGSGLAFVGRKGGGRGVAVNGRRLKTIDIYAHCAVPDALALMGHKLEGRRTGRILTWRPPCRCA